MTRLAPAQVDQSADFGSSSVARLTVTPSCDTARHRVTRSAGANGAFVAGTYVSNALVFPSAYSGGCGGYEPGLPGYFNPNGYAHWTSDYPGFGKCAVFASWTFAPTLSGGWKDTISASY